MSTTEVVAAIQPMLAPVLTLVGVWVGWRLGASSRRGERRMERLRERMEALAEILKVVDNVPPDIGRQELVERVSRDPEFAKSLSMRLLRLFGLRTELIATIDREIGDFIDERVRPVFEIAVGNYQLRADRISEFAAAAVDLRILTKRVERRLIDEYEQLIESAA